MAHNTRLQLVNYGLRFCRHSPVSSLDSTGSWPSKTYGTSDAGQMELYLDMAARSVLSREWQQTSRFFSTTLGVAGTITLPTNCIKAVPVGKHENRRWYKQNGSSLLYDAEGSTTTFPEDSYQLKVVEDEDVSNISDNNLQMLIAQEAARMYQAMLATDTRVDAFLAEQMAKSEISAGRTIIPSQRPLNSPLVPNLSPAQ